MMHKTLVLGLGNILLGDDGVGVRVVERLQSRCRFPADVLVLDGGTLGLDLLPYLEEAHRVLIVDALEMNSAPGTLTRLEDDEVEGSLSPKLSPHQMGLRDLLGAARLCGFRPGELILWGIQPGSVEVGLELSPAVAAQVDVVVSEVLSELGLQGAGSSSRPCGRFAQPAPAVQCDSPRTLL